MLLASSPNVHYNKNFNSRNISTTNTPVKLQQGHKNLNPMWVSGLTDAEGSFMITIIEDAKSKLK